MHHFIILLGLKVVDGRANFYSLHLKFCNHFPVCLIVWEEKQVRKYVSCQCEFDITMILKYIKSKLDTIIKVLPPHLLEQGSDAISSKCSNKLQGLNMYEYTFQHCINV